MKSPLFSLAWPAAAAAAFALAGCNNSEPAGNSDGATAAIEGNPPATVDEEGHSDDGHGHAHPTEGPHGGDLIELGEEEYHAEMVHDASSVTIYLLDSAAKNAVPIDATELTVNLKHDGKPEQVKLAAQPQHGDGDGKSSRFTAQDADLASHIDAEDSGARLMVQIAGKSYTGAIEHHHDHEGHDHEGEGHEGHSHE